MAMQASDRHARLLRLAFRITVIGLFGWSLAGCLEADTLGDEPPTEVQVGDPPAWDNGVGALMQLKCGVCHKVPLPDVSPDNTPTYFDLNHQFEHADGILGAANMVLFVQAGILRGDLALIPQMPLEQATPLTEAEITALEDWNGL